VLGGVGAAQAAPERRGEQRRRLPPPFPRDAPATRALFAAFGATQSTLDAFTDQLLSIEGLVPSSSRPGREVQPLRLRARPDPGRGAPRPPRPLVLDGLRRSPLTACDLTDRNVEDTDR